MTPALARLDAAFRAGAPMFHDVVTKARAALGPEWERLTSASVERLFPGDAELAAAVKGYTRFVLDVLRLQIKFEKTRTYASKTYAQAHEQVYANADYMQSQYLPGLLLSHYLWPHHHRQRNFFETAFLPELRRAGATSLYDIGVGTGFYSRLALSAVPELTVTGFDISPSSQAFAQWHVAAYGAADRYRVELRDVVAAPPPPTPWLVSVEVLEHLEDPVAFLRGLRALLAPGGKAFITTALNAPNADHIYLYRTAAEVLEQFEQTGFVVEQYFCARAGAPSFPGAPVAEVAAFIVT